MMSTTVDCTTLDGHKIAIPKERLILRPAAYGITVRRNKILLLHMKQNGKYHLPGGGIERGETNEVSLKREFIEETGLDVDVGTLAHFQEAFFYYDPSGNAYHGLHFYYLCSITGGELKDDEQVDDDAAEKPRWIGIHGLRAQDFQSHGKPALAVLANVKNGLYLP